MSTTLLAVFAVSVLAGVGLAIYGFGGLIAGREKPQPLQVWTPPERHAAPVPPAVRIVALPGLPPASTWGSKATGTPPPRPRAKGSVPPPIHSIHSIAYVPPIKRTKPKKISHDDDFLDEGPRRLPESSFDLDDDFLEEAPTKLDPRFLIVRSTRRRAQ